MATHSSILAWSFHGQRSQLLRPWRWEVGLGELSRPSGACPGSSDGKASTYNAGDPGSIPGSGRFPGEGNSNPLQYSCLENPMDQGAWWAIIHGVAKSRTRLSDFCVCVCVSVRGLRESKTYSLSYLKCRLTCFPCRQAQNLCSIQGDQRPALLLLMSAQDFPHFNFPKISLWIQYTSYQITSELFHKIRTKNFLQFLWIHTRPQDTKSNLEKDTKAILRKKKQNWSIQAP